MSLTYNQKRLLLLAYLLDKRRRKKKRIWMQPYLQQRTGTGEGAFHNLLAEMRLTDIVSFVEFFRVTPKQFENLLNLIGNKITPSESTFREPIFARDRLAVTLRFIATGDTMRSISHSFRISPSSMTKIVTTVCDGLRGVLTPIVLPSPDAQMWEQVAGRMGSSFQFPNCIGAIGGRVVKQGLLDKYSSEKIAFLAVCDAEHKFLIADVSVNDMKNKRGLSFQSSFLGKALANETLDLPPPTQLSGVTEKVPCVFAANHRFPLKWNLLKPYQNEAKDSDQDVFNYRLFRCQNLIDNAFGVMTSRFRIFSKPVNTVTTRVHSITMAVACLHNYLMSDESSADEPKYYCPEGFCDYEDSDGTLHEGAWRTFDVTGVVDMHPFEDMAQSVETAALRDTMKDYFSKGGSIPFQQDRVTAFNQT